MNKVNNSSNSPTPTTHTSDFLSKISFIIALYVSFLFSGIFEEKLYKGKYISDSDPSKTIKFAHSSIGILCNSFFSLIISSLVLNMMTKPSKTPFEKNDKLLLGTYYMLSRATAENSLNYLDFISKIIGKSCKSVSIIAIYFLYNVPFIGEYFLKTLVNQKSDSKVHTHGYSDLIKVLITTLSIILFNCEESTGGKSVSIEVFRSIILGYGLLIVSLFFDGLMALKEKIINHETHHNPEYAKYKSCLSWEYMNLFSWYSSLFCVVVLAYELFFGNLLQSITIYFQSKELIVNLLCYSLTSSLGQVFLFQFLEKYGPLTLSIITGVRKILSIALSILFFGKVVSVIKIISLILGTTVIAWEIFDKTTKPHHGHSHDTVDKENKKIE